MSSQRTPRNSSNSPRERGPIVQDTSRRGRKKPDPEQTLPQPLYDAQISYCEWAKRIRVDGIIDALNKIGSHARTHDNEILPSVSVGPHSFDGQRMVDVMRILVVNGRLDDKTLRPIGDFKTKVDKVLETTRRSLQNSAQQTVDLAQSRRSL